ncbi:PHD finger protein ALFIN-LIKE 7-like [Neltuma alba]|uniref:PHD finger protein ALFIN-LIKE 7-like n=1 Tax=Neltuma alba TaxID=207710 RepID=UPI0010A485D8|nr:PHD finger protein ALFIN-LIKE 7-like [Prosopis alba]
MWDVKRKESKSKKVTSRKPKETSRKPKETTSRSKTAVTFEREKHLGTSEGLSSTFDQPKCHLCCGDACTLNYIACEICGEWFHGDAFGLTLENVRQLIGFRCHVCRDRTAPMCPHKNNNAMTHAEIKAATEYAEELHNSVSLQPLSQV